MRVTISAIKADIGGIGGHTCPSIELLDTVRNFVVKNAKGLLIDQYIGYTGDDIHIVMTHTRGVDDDKIHKLAWDAFTEGTKQAKYSVYLLPTRPNQVHSTYRCGVCLLTLAATLAF